MEFYIKSRKFLVPINDRIYQLAKKKVEKSDCTIEQVINELLDHNLVEMK